MENNPEIKIYSAGYAETFHGNDDFSSEFSSFYEKEPEGDVGSSNLYVLSSGTPGTLQPEVSARFTAKKILYEYFHSYDYVDANKLALAMRSANNEIYEYARVQGEPMSASAIAAAVTDGKAAIATVGRARAYIIRNGKVFQITEDPAVVDEKVQTGELSPEEAYGPDGIPENIPALLGTAKDITTDIYDGIEVRGGDILLLCSASLETFIGKAEIMDAVADNNARKIVQQLLSYTSLQNANVPASVAAIRIYDNSSVDTMIRVDGDTPEDTDLNTERKEVELLRKNRPHYGGGDGNKKKSKLPLILFLLLLLLALLAGGIYAAARYGLIPDEYREKYLGNLVPSTETPTPTIDWVRESMTVYEVTAEAEKAAAVAATVQAWPTYTPYPTFTPVFIDLNETEEPVVVVVPSDEDEDIDLSSDDENTGEEGDDEQTSQAVTGFDTETQTEEGSDTEPAAEDAEPEIKENYVDPKSGAEMIYIPAGNFLLGSNLSVDEYAIAEEEAPQLTVYLDGYWMNKTEVTNDQYRKCVDAGICEMGGYMSIYSLDLAEYPVTYVSLEQAERFCSWIGGRVPSEYEWEKAARGTDGRIYPWGSEEPSTSNNLANVPNYVDANGNGYDLFAVGSFPKGESPYGLLDMAGNVWEWTSTWFSVNYYETLNAEAEISGSVIRNPEGPEFGSTQVIRGGSCASTEVNTYPSFMRTASRSYLNLTSSYYVGFRCMVPDTGDTNPAAQQEFGYYGY